MKTHLPKVNLDQRKRNAEAFTCLKKRSAHPSHGCEPDGCAGQHCQRCVKAINDREHSECREASKDTCRERHAKQTARRSEVIAIDEHRQSRRTDGGADLDEREHQAHDAEFIRRQHSREQQICKTEPDTARRQRRRRPQGR